MNNASVVDATGDLESADCKGCGKTDWQRINSANAGVYLRCRYCNYYIQSSDSETNSKALFESEQLRNYATEAPCTTALFDYLSSERNSKRLQLLKKYLSAGKVIEVGPGAGQMLTQVAASGYEVQGVEHSPSLARRITGQTGIVNIPRFCRHLKWSDNAPRGEVWQSVIRRKSVVHFLMNTRPKWSR